MKTIVKILSLAAAMSANAVAQTPNGGEAAQLASEPAYVAPERGLHVRAHADPQAPILTTLWQGARVFVRDQHGQYVRIDGYGVAGFAFVDAAFLTDTPAPIAAPMHAHAPPPNAEH
jgi:hypothetical protein